MLAVGQRRQRIGQAFGAHRLEMGVQLVDFLLRAFEPLLERAIAGFHLARGVDQLVDDVANAVGPERGRELLVHAGEIGGVNDG